MPVKSLKYYFKESSINNEVNTWSFEDCCKYLQKHERDAKQSDLLKKKLSIVQKRRGSLLHEANLLQLVRYREIPSLSSDIKSMIERYIKSLCRSIAPSERRTIFSKWRYSDIAKIAPKECLDSSHPNWLKIRSYRNTGLYLWIHGYNVKRPLGAGGFGCVWECDGQAVEIIPNHNAAKLEIVSAEKIAQLVGEDKSGKCKKYFNYLVSEGKNSSILKGVLAHGDLLDSARERVSSKRAETKKSTKTIASLLRQLIQVGKSLIALHNLGYSHNDVKPQNFLKVDKSIINASKANALSKDGKVHKHRIQLADFGGITKIPQNPQQERECAKSKSKLVFTPYYSPKNIQLEYTKEAVEKRDVFALGASGLELLLEKIPLGKRLPEPRAIIKEPNELIYEKCKLGEYYGGCSRKNMYNFLDTIRFMMNESYHLRPYLEDAVKKLRMLKSEK